MLIEKKKECAGRERRRRGSGLAFMVVLSVVITGMVMTLAFASSVQAAAATVQTQSDEAQLAADAAVNWAVVKLRSSPTWRPSGTTVTVNGWTCTVTSTDMGPSIGMATGVLGNPLKFTATATKTGVNGTATVSANAQGIMSYAPQFWSGSNLTVAESAKIAGDVETLGTLTLNPPTSGPTANKGATGNWKAKGGITDNNPGASGTGKYFTGTPTGNVSSLTAPSSKAVDVYNNLMAGPYVDLMTCLTIDGTGHYVIDFSKAGGKPVHYSGAASYIGNVGVVSSSTPGNDTLIIDGDATFTGSYPYNLAYAPLNMVVHGNCSFNGSGNPGVAIHGSFYVTGNWTQGGTYDFAGTIITDGTTSLGGTGTVATGSPPSFDPRYVPKVTGFIGNLP